MTRRPENKRQPNGPHATNCEPRNDRQRSRVSAIRRHCIGLGFDVPQIDQFDATAERELILLVRQVPSNHRINGNPRD